MRTLCPWKSRRISESAHVLFFFCGRSVDLVFCQSSSWLLHGFSVSNRQDEVCIDGHESIILAWADLLEFIRGCYGFVRR